MGTSVSHPSPQTPKWKKVCDIYWDRHSGEKQLVQRLAETMGYKDLANLASPGVTACLETLIKTIQAAPSPLVDLNQMGNRVAEFHDTALAAQSGLQAHSLASEIALRSACRTLAEHLAGSPETRGAAGAHPDNIVRVFIGRYLGELMDHFTSRDTGAAVGNNKIPNLARLESIVAPVSRACNANSRAATVSGRLKRHLSGYDRLPAQFRRARVSRALRDGLRETLRLLKQSRAA